MVDVVKREDRLLEKISDLVQQREDLRTLLARAEAELALYRTLVSRASLDPAHV